MTNRAQQNFYTNPAFCQQSEFINAQRRALSPARSDKSTRQSPLGAQTVHVLDTSIRSVREEAPTPKQKQYEVDHDEYEQEFYEEMLVDDAGYVQEKKILVVSSQQNDRTEKDAPQRSGARYASVPDNYSRNQHRYEYIPEQDQKPMRRPQEDHVELPSGRMHRYAVIPSEEEQPNPKTKGGRYALVPLEEIQNKSRYAVISDSEIQNNSRYDYIKDDRLPQTHQTKNYQRPVHQEQQSYHQQQQQPRRGNPIATQKLHELLQTPKKSQRQYLQTTPRQILSPVSPRKVHQLSPNIVLPNRTPQKVMRQTPRAQQKLNYTIGQLQQQEKKHTAIVAPICSSPVQSVYSETTLSKSESWMNLSMRKPPVQGTLAVAALMMILCGTVTSALCFYMISIMGRLYFLDLGVIAGFTCLLLGMLGFRTRNCYWLPNRNYISGYIVLSVFSLITCGGLLLLLFTQPKPGSPLADMTSGAVCGISVLSLILAFGGIMASYCCKYPPPDNRVQHCARGFTV